MTREWAWLWSIGPTSWKSANEGDSTILKLQFESVQQQHRMKAREFEEAKRSGEWQRVIVNLFRSVEPGEWWAFSGHSSWNNLNTIDFKYVYCAKTSFLARKGKSIIPIYNAAIIIDSKDISRALQERFVLSPLEVSHLTPEALDGAPSVECGPCAWSVQRVRHDLVFIPMQGQ